MDMARKRRNGYFVVNIGQRVKVLVSSSTLSFPYWAYLLPILSQEFIPFAIYLPVIPFLSINQNLVLSYFHSDIILIYLFHLYFSLFIINFQFFPLFLSAGIVCNLIMHVLNIFLPLQLPTS